MPARSFRQRRICAQTRTRLSVSDFALPLATGPNIHLRFIGALRATIRRSAGALVNPTEPYIAAPGDGIDMLEYRHSTPSCVVDHGVQRRAAHRVLAGFTSATRAAASVDE